MKALFNMCIVLALYKCFIFIIYRGDCDPVLCMNFRKLTIHSYFKQYFTGQKFRRETFKSHLTFPLRKIKPFPSLHNSPSVRMFAVWVFFFFLNFLFLQIGNVSLTGWTFTVALCLHLVVFNSNLVKNVRYLLKRCLPKRQNVLDPRYIISGFIYTKIKGNIFIYSSIHLFLHKF